MARGFRPKNYPWAAILRLTPVSDVWYNKNECLYMRGTRINTHTT